jgi:hypothetical protein
MGDQTVEHCDFVTLQEGMSASPMTNVDAKKLFSNRAGMFACAILLFSAFCAYQISVCSPITAYAGMDPRGSTLVAQSLIEHGTIRVDGYKLPAAPWLFEVKNGHTYGTYPLGTPLLVLPFVAMALSQGSDMQIDNVDFGLQKQVAGLTLIVFMCLAYLILRCFAEPVTSALTAAGWTLGSGVMSTMGAALWSVNFTVIFECIVVLILVRYFTGKSNRLRPFVVGLFLFAAYLCRPSAALVAVPIAILFWRQSKVAAIKMVATFWVLLLLLCVFSLREFGTGLPGYYSLYGANAAGISFVHWRKALYGLTFGPARGLFVYQPFLFLVLLAVALTIRRLWRNPLFWLAASWIVLDLLLVSRWPMWWGGGGFGSRLLVESFPAWVVLTGLVWSELSIYKEHFVSFALCFGMLAGIGLFYKLLSGLV